MSEVREAAQRGQGFGRLEDDRKVLTHLSLCTGIGGIDLAAEWAGFKTIGQCEIDEYASRVLEKNFKGVYNFHDIRAITDGELREHGIGGGCTVLSAGFPCQPYSLAGKGLGDGDKRDLWGEVARCIGLVRPKWFVGENTPGLFARSNQRYFRRIVNDLSALGYSTSWGMWGACDVGAPHKRERVFIVARNISDPTCKRFGASKEVQCRKPVQSGSEKFRGELSSWGVQSSGIRSVLSDTAGLRMEERQSKSDIGQESERRDDKRRHKKENDPWEWWEIEPNVGRVVDGISNRVDRLRCLGNAVVPYQIYPIFKAIAEIEGGSK